MGVEDNPRMDTVVFMSRFGSPREEEVGRAVLVDGEVQFTGDMAPGGSVRKRISFDTTNVFDSRGHELAPADGRHYLEELPRAFHGTYFWAALVD
jgi:hypothetical protein